MLSRMKQEFFCFLKILIPLIAMIGLSSAQRINFNKNFSRNHNGGGYDYKAPTTSATTTTSTRPPTLTNEVRIYQNFVQKSVEFYQKKWILETNSRIRNEILILLKFVPTCFLYRNLQSFISFFFKKWEDKFKKFFSKV